MRPTIRLGRVLGIPIGIDISWFVSLALIVSTLAFQIYPEVLPRETRLTHVALAAVSGLVFFACVVLHELGHSAVAKYYGIPVKSITLFLLGGVAQITRDATKPLPELLMALAGPCVSVLLGGVFMLAWLLTGQGHNPLSIMWEWLWVMNIAIGIFNLAPAFPMDGGRVLRASLWGISHSLIKATRWAVWVSRVLAWALMAFGLFGALDTGWLGIEIGTLSGLWMAFIGFFLLRNADGSLKQVKLLDELGKHRVDEVMLRDLPAVYQHATVREMLSGPLMGYGPSREWALVSGGDSFAGILPRVLATRVPDEAWDTRVAADVMIPASGLYAIAPDKTLADAFQSFQEHETRLLPVVDAGAVVGLVHEGLLGRWLKPDAAGGAA